MAEELAAYVGAIENAFVDIRGRGVQWSPVDSAHAQAWHELGLPLGAALQVLESRVKAYRFRHGPTATLPMHLGWYEPAIVHQVRHLTRIGRPLQAAANDPVPLSLTDLLDALPDVTATAGDDLVRRRAYDQAFTMLDGALHEAEAPEVTTVIDKVRKAMLRTLEQGLDEDAAAQLATVVAADLAPLRGQMAKKALATREAMVKARWLAAYHGVHLPSADGWQAPPEWP